MNPVLWEGFSYVTDYTITSCVIEDGVTSIGDHAFNECYALTSIEIPDSVTSIGRSAFMHCENLTSIALPEGVTNIGDYAFCKCKKITSVEIPEGVTDIGNYAFSSCERLSSIEIPDSVTSIGDFAFEGCAVTDITLPAGLTAVGRCVFTDLRLGVSDVVNIHMKISDPSAVQWNSEFWPDWEAMAAGDENPIYIYYPYVSEKMWQPLIAALDGENDDIPSRFFRPDGKLENPKLIKLSNTTSGLKVTWNPVEGAVKYRVFYRAAGTENWKRAVDTTGTCYTIPNLIGGKKYTVTVRCITGDGSGYTSYFDKTGLTLLYLNPIAVSVSNTGSGLKLSWPKITGAKTYYVYRKVDGKYTRIATITNPDTLTYTDTSVKNNNGTAYSYAVKAGNGSTYGAYVGKSYYRLTGIDITSLSNPSAGKMTVKWSKNSRITDYQIQYSTSSSFATDTKTVTVSGASTVSKTIGSLTKGKTYYVRVRAYKVNSANNKYYTAWSSKSSLRLTR